MAKKGNYFTWTDLKIEIIEKKFIVDLEKMAKKHNLKTEEVYIAINFYSDENRFFSSDIFFNGFGSKNEPYFSEEEQLRGFVPEIEKLSGWELEHFLSDKKE